MRTGRFISIVTIVLFLTGQGIETALPQTERSEKNGSIAGRILLPNGSPAADVRVAAISAPPGALPTANPLLMSLSKTDSDGSFILTDVPPGRYLIVAGPLDALAYFPGVMSENEATTLTVTAGTVLDTGDFRLRVPLTVTVRGHVIHEAGQNVTGVVLSNESRDVFLTAPMNANGSFEFTNIRSGTYWISARPDFPCLSPAGVVFDRDVTDLDVVIPPASPSGTVEFIVKAEGPLPALQLALTPAVAPPDACKIVYRALSPRMTMNIQSSKFTWQIPLGEYYVAIDSPRESDCCSSVGPVISVVAGSTDLRRRPLKVSAEGIPSVEIMLANMGPRDRTVSGRIVVAGTAPPPRFSLFLVPARSPFAEGAVDQQHAIAIEPAADGTFSAAAAKGAYDLSVERLPFGVEVTSITRDGAVLRSQPFRISTEDTGEVRVQLSLDPTHLATVSGRATGVDPRQAPIRLTLQGGGLSTTFETDLGPDGAFKITGIPPGAYKLKLDGAVNRAVSGTLVLREIIGDGPHRAEDMANLEIVVPPSADQPAVLRHGTP